MIDSRLQALFEAAPKVLPVVHRDWRGHILLDVETNSVTHAEAGQKGKIKMTPHGVSIAWDAYPEESFVVHNGKLYHKDLGLKFIEEADKVPTSQAIRLENIDEVRSLPIYIMHYTPLKDRRRYMEQQLLRNGFKNFAFITRFDREDLSEIDVKTFYFQNKYRYEAMTEFLRPRFCELLQWNSAKSSWSHETDYSAFPVLLFQPLTPAELSLCCKHIDAMENFCKSEADIGIFLEDDAIFSDGFLESLLINFRTAPDCWDVVFPGLGAGPRPPNRCAEQNWYQTQPPLNRASDSYILTKFAANALVRHMSPVSLPSDFELFFWINALQLRTYWWEPALITQGSFDGTFVSSLRD